MKYLYCALLTLFYTAAPAFTQSTDSRTDDLARRVRELEQKVESLQKKEATAELTELRQEIEVLAQEIENLKVSREKTSPSASEPQYGMGAAASKVYRSDAGVSIGGYGEMSYANFSGRNDAGERAEQKDAASVLRAVLYTGYKFNDRTVFNSELEVENGSTERDGAVSTEFAYLDFLHHPALNIRAGLVLLPIGLVNTMHEPTAILSARRPEVETSIIPATWGEIGAGAFGDVGAFSYQTYVLTGMDSSRFSAEGIREGRQAGASATAEDFAWSGRLDWHPVEGAIAGGSLYTGNSAQGRHAAGGEPFKGRVTLAELHGDVKVRGLSLRALWASGRVGDAAAISQANGLSVDDGVGSRFGGWYGEAGYDVATLLHQQSMSITPFVRYESLDTQKRVDAPFVRNREFDRSVTTVGVSWKPVSQTVIKLDFQNFRNAEGTGLDQFNLALGYIF